MDLAELAHQVDRLNDEIGDTPEAVQAGSDFAADSALITKYRPAHDAWAGMSRCLDNLQSLVGLLEHPRIEAAYAPFSLIRAALENAALAFWLVDPDESKTRVSRCLQYHYTDLAHANDFIGEMDPGAQARVIGTGRPPVELKKEILAFARAAEIARGPIKERLNYYKMIKAIGESMWHGLPQPDMDPAAVSWRMCSGLSHGQSWAGLSILAREVMPSDEAGVSLIRLTADLERVLLNAQFPIVIAWRALGRLRQRSRA